MQTKSDSVFPFLAGLGIGITAAVLFAPGAGRKNRQQLVDFASQAGESLKKRVADAGEAAEVLRDGLQAWTVELEKDGRALSGLKDEAKDRLGDAASAAKAMAGEVAGQSREVLHSAGAALETGGKRLQSL